MKKYFISSLFISFFVTTVFAFGALVPTTPVSAQSMSVSELIELLITIGVIAPDKAVAARAVIDSLNQTTTTASTSTSPLPYVQVLTPNGGESWEIDLDIPYTITWGSSSKIPVNISLISSKKGSICNLTSSPITSKSTNNTYSVLLKTAKCYDMITGTSTSLIDGSYRAQVSYVNGDGVIVEDESDTNFKILPVPIPSIRVTYPNGGESLVRNTEYEVKYKFTNVTNVVNNLIYLYLLDVNGNTAYNSHKIKRSDNTYSLDLPSSLSAGAYKIKLITTTNDNRVEIDDSSDDFFWISTGL